MKYKKIITILFALFCFNTLHADDLTGFWQTMDKKTKKPSSVIAVYLYNGKYYGKIVATFNNGVLEDTLDRPQSRAPGLVGNPPYCGLDFVWVAEGAEGGKHKGYVVDPKEGKSYNAKMWKENGNLILRGELLCFGRNEVLPPFSERNFSAQFPKPDLNAMVPKIHQLKGSKNRK